MNKLIKSFQNAFRGLKEAFLENSFRIMIFCGIAALLFSILFPLELLERIIIIFLIGTVLSLEMLNSQLERALDLFIPEKDERVRKIKDISSGAVLVISFTSLVILVIIVLSKIL